MFDTKATGKEAGKGMSEVIALASKGRLSEAGERGAALLLMVFDHGSKSSQEDMLDVVRELMLIIDYELKDYPEIAPRILAELTRRTAALAAAKVARATNG